MTSRSFYDEFEVNPDQHDGCDESGPDSGGAGFVVVPLEELRDGDVSYAEDVTARLIREEEFEEIRKYESAHRPELWRVIEFRWGLADGHPHTLEETAAEFGLTREHVRQQEQIILYRSHSCRIERPLQWWLEIYN